MNLVNYLFLLVFLLVLATMLATSRVIRAIVWESLRHPFSHSRIVVAGGKVEVEREGDHAPKPAPPAPPSPPAGPPVGAR
jgi:hypothetical protein